MLLTPERAASRRGATRTSTPCRRVAGTRSRTAACRRCTTRPTRGRGHYRAARRTARLPVGANTAFHGCVCKRVPPRAQGVQVQAKGAGAAAAAPPPRRPPSAAAVHNRRRRHGRRQQRWRMRMRWPLPLHAVRLARRTARRPTPKARSTAALPADGQRRPRRGGRSRARATKCAAAANAQRHPGRRADRAATLAAVPGVLDARAHGPATRSRERRAAARTARLLAAGPQRHDRRLLPPPESPSLAAAPPLREECADAAADAAAWHAVGAADARRAAIGAPPRPPDVPVEHLIHLLPHDDCFNGGPAPWDAIAAAAAKYELSYPYTRREALAACLAEPSHGAGNVLVAHQRRLPLRREERKNDVYNGIARRRGTTGTAPPGTQAPPDKPLYYMSVGSQWCAAHRHELHLLERPPIAKGAAACYGCPEKRAVPDAAALAAAALAAAALAPPPPFASAIEYGEPTTACDAGGGREPLAPWRATECRGPLPRLPPLRPGLLRRNPVAADGRMRWTARSATRRCHRAAACSSPSAARERRGRALNSGDVLWTNRAARTRRCAPPRTRRTHREPPSARARRRRRDDGASGLAETRRGSRGAARSDRPAPYTPWAGRRRRAGDGHRVGAPRLRRRHRRPHASTERRRHAKTSAVARPTSARTRSASSARPPRRRRPRHRPPPTRSPPRPRRAPRGRPLRCAVRPARGGRRRAARSRALAARGAPDSADGRTARTTLAARAARPAYSTSRTPRRPARARRVRPDGFRGARLGAPTLCRLRRAPPRAATTVAPPSRARAGADARA